MIALIIRRIFQSFVVMLVVAMVAFTLFRYVGDPVSQMVGQETTIAEREQLREDLGLNDPIFVQFVRFGWNTIRGKFGISYRLGRPVNELFAERLPATLELSLIAALFSLVVGIPMGVYTGLYPDRILSKVFQAVSLLGISLPTFLIGILLILFFGVLLGWLPTFGRGDVIQLGWWSTGLLTAGGLKAVIMPAFTLGMFQLTLIMRMVRSEMMEVLRTTLVPVITITGLQIGSIIAFALITETVFQWPGMGLLFLQAIQFADIPVMSTYLILIAFFFVVINLIVDLLYHVVDPRLRFDKSVVAG